MLVQYLHHLLPPAKLQKLGLHGNLVILPRLMQPPGKLLLVAQALPINKLHLLMLFGADPQPGHRPRPEQRRHSLILKRKLPEPFLLRIGQDLRQRPQFSFGIPHMPNRIRVRRVGRHIPQHK